VARLQSPAFSECRPKSSCSKFRSLPLVNKVVSSVKRRVRPSRFKSLQVLRTAAGQGRIPGVHHATRQLPPSVLPQSQQLSFCFEDKMPWSSMLSVHTATMGSQGAPAKPSTISDTLIHKEPIEFIRAGICIKSRRRFPASIHQRPCSLLWVMSLN
jgi:hypothetical protein